MIKVLFKGTDITEKVSINRCYHDMYAENQSDTLHIRFNDTQNQWDRWNPKTGDEIQVVYGSISTGKMFVDSANPENGLYDIIAASVPQSAKEIKSKAWQKVKLTQIGAEIANYHGLSFNSYGVTDVLYSYILQTNTNDFDFFQRLCTLEGCAFLIYDGILVMYSQPYMEQITPLKDISLSIDADYRYVDNSSRQYGVCRIERGIYKSEFNAGNGYSRVYVPDIDMTINNKAEADRFAKNLLRKMNKSSISGFLHARIMPEYAAASTAKLSNIRAPSWDGSVFITHIRNDYGKGQSKISFRKPLNGY